MQEVMPEIKAAREKGKIAFYKGGKIVILEKHTDDGVRPTGPHSGWRHGIIMDHIGWMRVPLKIALEIETLFFT